MWYGIYDPGDGNRLVSITSLEPAPVLSFVSQEDDPRRMGWGWNPALPGFVYSDPPQPPLTPMAFFDLFTADEYVAVIDSGNANVRRFVALAEKAQEIRLDDPRTIAGLQYLESQGLIGAGRAAEVLAWQQA